MRKTMVSVFLWSCMLFCLGCKSAAEKHSNSAAPPAPPPVNCAGTSSNVSCKSFDPTTGSCLYDVNKVSGDIIIDTTQTPAQSIHFHSANLTNIRVLLDPSCTQLAARCGAHPDPFKTKYDGTTPDANDINTGAVVNHDKNTVCQYKLQIKKGGSFGDPIIIVK